MYTMQEAYNLILVGASGNGKSSSGNTLISQKRFTEEACATAVTRAIKIYSSNDRIPKRTVVDTPGLKDGSMKSIDDLKQLNDALEEAMRPTYGGYDAILLVMAYSNRLMTDQKDTIECLKKMLGDEFMNFCIVVMTKGDLFEEDHKETRQSFEDWYSNQTGEFRSLVDACNRRLVLFNNRETDETRKEAQLSKLLALVDSLRSCRYGATEFRESEASRKRLVAEAKQDKVKKKTLKKKEDLFAELTRAKAVRNLEDQRRQLDAVKVKAADYLESLREKDDGTGVLNDEIRLFEDLLSSIETNLRLTSAEGQRAAQQDGSCTMQ